MSASGPTHMDAGGQETGADMKVTDDIHRVDRVGGANAYVVTSQEDGLLLVDTGLPGNAASRSSKESNSSPRAGTSSPHISSTLSARVSRAAYSTIRARSSSASALASTISMASPSISGTVHGHGSPASARV